jgi:hypothetical protein
MTDLFESVFDGLPIRPVTRRLVEALLLDVPLTPAVSVDFGVESALHYRALREALDVPAADSEDDEEEASADVERELRTRIVELEQAVGNGAKLTEFIKRYAPHDAAHVTFETSGDVLAGRTTVK